MTLDEAMAALDVSAEDDATAVESAFQQRIAALAGQIATAPTPSLREKYQQQVARNTRGPIPFSATASHAAVARHSR